MDLAALIRARAIAPAFTREYQEREALVEAQLLMREECKGVQADILSSWISVNVEWLADNKEKYEQLKALATIPEAELKLLTDQL